MPSHLSECKQPHKTCPDDSKDNKDDKDDVDNNKDPKTEARGKTDGSMDSTDWGQKPIRAGSKLTTALAQTVGGVVGVESCWSSCYQCFWLGC